MAPINDLLANYKMAARNRYLIRNLTHMYSNKNCCSKRVKWLEINENFVGIDSKNVKLILENSAEQSTIMCVNQLIYLKCGSFSVSTYRTGLGRPMGVRLVWGFGNVFRIRMDETFFCSSCFLTTFNKNIPFIRPAETLNIASLHWLTSSFSSKTVVDSIAVSFILFL